MRLLFSWYLLPLTFITSGSVIGFDLNTQAGEAPSSTASTDTGLNDLIFPSSTTDGVNTDWSQFSDPTVDNIPAEISMMESEICVPDNNQIASKRRVRRGSVCRTVGKPAAGQDSNGQGDARNMPPSANNIIKKPPAGANLLNNQPNFQKPPPPWSAPNLEICPGDMPLPVCALDKYAKMHPTSSGYYLLLYCHLCAFPPLFLWYHDLSDQELFTILGKYLFYWLVSGQIIPSTNVSTPMWEKKNIFGVAQRL